MSLISVWNADNDDDDDDAATDDDDDDLTGEIIRWHVFSSLV